MTDAPDRPSVLTRVAGVGLIGACDLVVCARTTRIRPAYGAIGFTPDGGRGRGPARDGGAALEEQLDDEAQLIAESAADPEGREGVRAFVEKRAPDFRNPR